MTSAVVFRKQAACKHIVLQTAAWQADCTMMAWFKQ